MRCDSCVRGVPQPSRLSDLGSMRQPNFFASTQPSSPPPEYGTYPAFCLSPLSSHPSDSHAPYSPAGGTPAHSVLTPHNKPVPTTPYSPAGGTTTPSVLTSHNTPVPTKTYSPAGGTTAHSVLTSRNKPVPTTHIVQEEVLQHPVY